MEIITTIISHEINWAEIFDLTNPSSDLTLVQAATLYCRKHDIDYAEFIKKCDPIMLDALKIDAITNNHVKLNKPEQMTM